MPSWITGLTGCPFQTHDDCHSEHVNADCLAGPLDTNIIYSASGSQQASIKFAEPNSGIIFVNGLMVNIVSWKKGTALVGNTPDIPQS
jgi:hypothetical protein